MISDQRSRLSVSTKKHQSDSWKNCTSEQKLFSNVSKIVCDEPTIAKYLKISVAGIRRWDYMVRLYLNEVEVVGNSTDGEYGYIHILFFMSHY